MADYDTVRYDTIRNSLHSAEQKQQTWKARGRLAGALNECIIFIIIILIFLSSFFFKIFSYYLRVVSCHFATNRIVPDGWTGLFSEQESLFFFIFQTCLGFREGKRGCFALALFHIP